MKIWKRIVVWGGLALIIAALLALALVPQPLPADFSEVTRGPLRVTLDEEGETRVRDRFVISAPLGGRVMRIEHEPGDPVHAGVSVLATLLPNDPSLLDARSRSEARAKVKAARAALERAGAEHERALAQRDYALSDLERSRRLAREGIVSDEALEIAELEARTHEEAARATDFSVRNLRYELEVAQSRLLSVDEYQAAGSSGTIRVRSPVDGVVLRRLLQSEMVVVAGEPLMEVADPARLEIAADFLSRDAVRIRSGQAVLIEQWGGDRSLRGRVRRVEPSGFTKISALGVEEQRVNVIIDFDDAQEAWASLGDGYRVEVRVIIWEKDDVLRAPTSCLFRSGDSWAAFVVEEKRARLREVEIGRRSGLEAEVLSGLEPGERVVAHPGDSIVDGVRVTGRDGAG